MNNTDVNENYLVNIQLNHESDLINISEDEDEDITILKPEGTNVEESELICELKTNIPAPNDTWAKKASHAKMNPAEDKMIKKNVRNVKDKSKYNTKNNENTWKEELDLTGKFNRK